MVSWQTWSFFVGEFVRNPFNVQDFISLNHSYLTPQGVCQLLGGPIVDLQAMCPLAMWKDPKRSGKLIHQLLGSRFLLRLFCVFHVFSLFFHVFSIFVILCFPCFVSLFSSVMTMV